MTAACNKSAVAFAVAAAVTRRTHDVPPSNDVDDRVGGVRVAVAVVVADAAAAGGRRRGRVQGGSADDHQAGLAVRPGTVRAGHRPGPGHGQRKVPGTPQHTSQESRD